MAKQKEVKKGAMGIQGQTKLCKCKCVSEYQDKMYGKNMRVCNTGAKAHSCTVCSANHVQEENEEKLNKKESIIQFYKQQQFIGEKKWHQ